MKLISVIKGWLNIQNSINEKKITVICHINRLKKKSHTIMSKGTEKAALDKI